eukprot:8183169-Alexandrium_andersonii.AAC.1
MLAVLSTQPGSKWQWLDSEAKATDMAGRFKTKGRQAELLILVTNAQAAQPPEAYPGAQMLANSGRGVR